MKKILIIGATGFLGSYLRQYFLSANYDIVLTSHSNTKTCIRFSRGDKVPETLKNTTFDAILYLAHDYMIDNQENLIKWYENIFYTLKQQAKKHIYLSSYSANKYAVSNYGKTKYAIEKLFIEGGGISLSPGLILGNGGIYNKIQKMVLLLPLVPIPTLKKTDKLPVISVDNVAFIVKKIIEEEYERNSFTVYDTMISLIILAKDIAYEKQIKRFIFPINAQYILYFLKFFEKLKLKIPVTSDSLNGFIANQEYQVENDLNKFIKGRE